MARDYTPQEVRRLTDEWLAAQTFEARQDENGVDLVHLRANLALTPTERILRLQERIPFLEEVRRAAHAAGLRRSS